MDIAECLMPLEYMALDCFLALDTIAIGSEAVKTLAATIGMLAARCQLRAVRLKPSVWALHILAICSSYRASFLL